MKPSKLLVHLRRPTVARISLIMASCVAAGAVALAAPQSSSLNRNIPTLARGAMPASTDQSDLRNLKNAPVSVMIELDAPAAAVLYANEYKVAQASSPKLQRTGRIPMSSAQKDVLPRVQIDSAAVSRVANHAATLEAAQKALLPAVANTGAQVIYRTQKAYNGIAVRVAPEKIADLAKLPGVKAVRPIVPKYQTAFSDVDFLGARTFWTKPYGDGNVGLHGEGVKVAVIDSGLDYTHANFGGPGTANYAGISDKSPVPNAYYPTAKVPFGYDFAGDDYNADPADPDFQPVPHPDNNPLDSSNGHGTACASLVGGFGVNAGSSTYQGNYDDATPLAGMKISPGMAPRAKLIPLRVFGIKGSTDLTTEAIEFAMDPNGDGDLNDHVDIISMSLGSNWGTADDDSAVASSNAVEAGVIVTAASGNAGDSYYVTSSPASATGAISVAASYNDQAGYIYNLDLRVNKPTSLAGTHYYAIYGSESPRVADGSSRKVVQARSGDANPSQGCTAFSNAGAVAGNIALIDRGTCTFSVKIQNAQAAGAAAVIVINNAAGDPFLMSVPGTTIPSAMISKTDGDQFKTAAAFDTTTGVAANGANVTAFNRNGTISRTGVAADTMPTYSSRGPLLGTTALKPDITAPAEIVGVAQSGTGTGVENFNGTSSATPHVAGGLALMKQLHPDWTVEEIMALAMNTATHDLFKESGTAGTSAPSTTRRGVSRVGAGRMDLTKASEANVVIFNGTDHNRVSVSFGDVEVPVDGSVVLSKQVIIRNKGTEPVTYDLSYDPVNTVGDAAFSAAQSQYTVQAGAEVSVPVAFTATGSTLKHTKDASVSSGQATTLYGTLPRQYLSEAAGYAVFTPATPSSSPAAAAASTEPTIRIPVYAAPKPVAAMRTAQNGITPKTNTDTYNLQLTGRGIVQGNASPVDILSLVKPFECQYVSAHAGSSNFSSDPNVIKYVGVTSDYAVLDPGQKNKTAITFAIEGFGDASVPSYISSDKEVLIDVDDDGEDDFALYADQLAPSTNVYLSHLVNASFTEDFGIQYFTNIFPGNAQDTNAFNNSIILLTVDASSLGYTGSGKSNFKYRVATFDRSGSLVDLTPFMKFNIAKPGLDGTGPQGFSEGDAGGFYIDAPGGDPVTVAFNGANYQANKSKGVYMAHMHNGRAGRGELVEFRKPEISNFAPKQGPIGTTVTITGSNFNSGTKVEFSNGVPANNVNVLTDQTISCKVPAGTVTGPITVSNPAGSSKTVKDFTVTPGPSPSPSPSPSPTVSPTGR